MAFKRIDDSSMRVLLTKFALLGGAYCIVCVTRLWSARQSEPEMSGLAPVSYEYKQVQYTYLYMLQEFETESLQFTDMSFGMYTRKQLAYTSTVVGPRSLAGCWRLGSMSLVMLAIRSSAVSKKILSARF